MVDKYLFADINILNMFYIPVVVSSPLKHRSNLTQMRRTICHKSPNRFNANLTTTHKLGAQRNIVPTEQCVVYAGGERPGHDNKMCAHIYCAYHSTMCDLTLGPFI